MSEVKELQPAENHFKRGERLTGTNHTQRAAGAIAGAASTATGAIAGRPVPWQARFSRGRFPSIHLVCFATMRVALMLRLSVHWHDRFHKGVSV
jgi:hypothetical protein